MTTTPNANDVLMGAGGAPAAKFSDPGTTWEGTIVSPPQSHQVRNYDPNNPGGGTPKFFPSGDPVMGLTVDIQTAVRDVTIEDDDGIRRLYLDGRYDKEAVRNAVRAAGSPGLEVGGVLKITFTRREDPMDKRSRKFWDVTYTPAGNAALMADTAPAAPAQTAAPAAGAPTPADTAKQLIAAGITDDNVIASSTGLGADVIAALRNLPAAS